MTNVIKFATPKQLLEEVIREIENSMERYRNQNIDVDPDFDAGYLQGLNDSLLIVHSIATAFGTQVQISNTNQNNV